MCGIHGFVTTKKKNVNADDFLRDGFVAGSLRGTDSSGMALINVEKADAVWQKLPVAGPMFVNENYVRRLLREAAEPQRIAICHTRSATAGPVGMNEAHPFMVSSDEGDRDLIGVHNGTLAGWQGKKYASDFKVDSEWALNHIFDNGMEAFNDFAGAYCFVWWDSEDSDVLNIALNDQRPMNVAFTKDSGMVYASEAGMLYWLAERNRIALDGNIKQLMPNNWYKFDTKDLTQYTKTPLPTKKVVTTTTTSASSNSYHQSRPMHSSGGMTTYSNPVEKVERLLASLKADRTPSAGANVSSGHVNVTAEEILKAKSMSIMNRAGTFLPMIFHETAGGTVEGIFYSENAGEVAAIIRNVGDTKFNQTDLWHTTCIGMQDDGFDLVAVCSRPWKKGMVPDKSATETSAVA